MEVIKDGKEKILATCPVCKTELETGENEFALLKAQILREFLKESITDAKEKLKTADGETQKREVNAIIFWLEQTLNLEEARKDGKC